MLGTSPFAVTPFGASSTSPLPTVELLAPPTSVTSGGPSLTFRWQVTHRWGLTQSFWRLRLTDLNGTVTFYDSGRRSGSDGSWPVNLVELGVQPNASIRVAVTAEVGLGGAGLSATATQTVSLAWGQPSAIVTAPADGAVATSPLTATWLYSDTEAKPQAAYRVELLSATSSVRVFDSGWLTGSAESYPIPYTFPAAGSYRLRLTVRNVEGVESTPILSTFSLNAEQVVEAVDPNVKVGTIYEVGLNGEGWMLYDGRDERQDWRYRRRVVPLDAPRLSTGDTPFNQSFDRYSFGGLYDFTGGAGQSFYQRGDTSSESAFFSSSGVDVTDRTHLRLLPAVETVFADIYTNPLMTVAGDRLVVLYDNKGLKVIQPASTATLDLTPRFTSSTAVLDLASDGENWYAALGADGVLRGTGSVPASAWSTEPVEVCEWAANRLCVAYPGSGSSTANVFNTLTDAGLKEVAGGRLTLQPGWTITSISGGGTDVYFSGYRGSQSAIWAWTAGSADAPTLAAEIPWGHVVQSIFYYQGQVLVRASEKTPSGHDVHIYRGVQTQGSGLSLFLLHTFQVSSAAQAKGGFTANERLVFYSWPEGTAPGLGAVDLSTGGYSRWLQWSGGAGAVPAVARWNGRTVFSVAGRGVAGDTSTFVTSGVLQTSAWDGGGSTLAKVFDRVTVRCAPLGVSQSIRVRYSTDDGVTFTEPPGGLLSTVGATKKEWELGVRATSLTLQLELAGPGSGTPDLSVVEVKYHPQGVSDVIVEFPVACFDRVAGLNGKPIPEQAGQPGAGAGRARELEALTQQLVAFQDIDWKDSQAVELFEVLSADAYKVSVMDTSRGVQTAGKIVMLTLRKSGS